MNYENYIKELVKNDERFIIITAENRAAIRNLPEEIGEQFVDVGIAEQTMVGMAAGLALRGRIPVIHALATFLTMRAFEFIRTDVGIGNLPVKIVGSVAGFLSEANGPTHQSLEDISLMRGIPNVNVFCPADEQDLLIGLKKVLESPSPFYIRYTNVKPIFSHTTDFEIGKAEIIGDGSEEIIILTYGLMFNEDLKARDILQQKGFSIGLVNLRTLKTIDKNLIINILNNSSLVFMLEDHFLTGGLFSIIAEIAAEENVNANIFPIALKNKWFKPLLLENLLSYEKFDCFSIVEKIEYALKNMNKIVNYYY